METSPALDDDICSGNSLVHGSVKCVGSELELRRPNDKQVESSSVLDHAIYLWQDIDQCQCLILGVCFKNFHQEAIGDKFQKINIYGEAIYMHKNIYGKRGINQIYNINNTLRTSPSNFTLFLTVGYNKISYL